MSCRLYQLARFCSPKIQISFKEGSYCGVREQIKMSLRLFKLLRKLMHFLIMKKYFKVLMLYRVKQHEQLTCPWEQFHYLPLYWYTTKQVLFSNSADIDQFERRLMSTSSILLYKTYNRLLSLPDPTSVLASFSKHWQLLKVFDGLAESPLFYSLIFLSLSLERFYDAHLVVIDDLLL